MSEMFVPPVSSSPLPVIVDRARRFGGVGRLYGKAGAERIAQAHVVVETASDPFFLALRMLPADARALAANLVLAADRAEAVQASLDARRPS